MRYLNGRELVSASTDSTLRLWDTKACTASRVFNGHNNEKNFVGMSVDNDFIACGSETNEVGWSCASPSLSALQQNSHKCMLPQAHSCEHVRNEVRICGIPLGSVDQCILGDTLLDSRIQEASHISSSLTVWWLVRTSAYYA